MNINNLFRIADAAKNIGDYEIANAAFAAIACEAIAAKKYNSQCDAVDVEFVYEYAHEDIIGSLADPDGAGYYDLPALSYYGPTLMGGEREPHYLCIPLPLVSGYFINQMIRLIAEDAPNETYWMPRIQHDRLYWRMSPERREAARRDLERRLVQEAGQELHDACRLILRSEPEPEYIDGDLPTAQNQPTPGQPCKPGEAEMYIYKSITRGFATEYGFSEKISQEAAEVITSGNAGYTGTLTVCDELAKIGCPKPIMMATNANAPKLRKELRVSRYWPS